MHAIRTTLFGLAIACAALAHPASAQRNVKLDGNADSDVRIVARQPARRAASMLQTRGGNVALLLIDRTLVFQFTDAGLRRMEAESAPDEDDGIAARLIAGMVRGGLRRMFDHGLEYPLSELREARYADGQLILIDRDGEQVFEDMDVNGTDVMHSFPAAEGRAFAARINQELRRRSI